MRITHTENQDIRPGSGRPAKYLFDNLHPGQCLTITFPEGSNMAKEASRVSTALSNWKRRNNPDWITAVRNTLQEVHVHRIL